VSVTRLDTEGPSQSQVSIYWTAEEGGRGDNVVVYSPLEDARCIRETMTAGYLRASKEPDGPLEILIPMANVLVMYAQPYIAAPEVG
jgi:hypothetical protein